MTQVFFKFTTDLLVKQLNDLFKSRFNELDEIRKQNFLKEKPIDWSNKKCVICNLKLAVNMQEVCQQTKKITTWDNFTVQKGTV